MAQVPGPWPFMLAGPGQSQKLGVPWGWQGPQFLSCLPGLISRKLEKQQRSQHPTLGFAFKVKEPDKVRFFKELNVAGCWGRQWEGQAVADHHGVLAAPAVAVVPQLRVDLKVGRTRGHMLLLGGCWPHTLIPKEAV